MMILGLILGLASGWLWSKPASAPVSADPDVLKDSLSQLVPNETHIPSASLSSQARTTLHIRFWPLLVSSLLLSVLRGHPQVGVWLTQSMPQLLEPLIPVSVTKLAAAFLQYAAFVGFCLANWRWPGLPLLLAGGLANGLVILANGGRMPIGQAVERFGSLSVARIAQAPHYVLARGDEPLLLLGDLIPVWLFGWTMVSIGDIAIAIGSLLLGFRLGRLIRCRHHTDST